MKGGRTGRRPGRRRQTAVGLELGWKWQRAFLTGEGFWQRSEVQQPDPRARRRARRLARPGRATCVAPRRLELAARYAEVDPNRDTETDKLERAARRRSTTTGRAQPEAAGRRGPLDLRGRGAGGREQPPGRGGRQELHGLPAAAATAALLLTAIPAVDGFRDEQSEKEMRAEGLIAIALARSGVVPVVAAAKEEFGSAKEAEAMVGKAVAHIRAAGVAEGLSGLHRPGPGLRRPGPLRGRLRPDRASVLAHGQNPKMVGKELIDLRDPDGKEFVKERVDLARSKGKFWHDYKFTDPLTQEGPAQVDLLRARRGDGRLRRHLQALAAVPASRGRSHDEARRQVNVMKLYQRILLRTGSGAPVPARASERSSTRALRSASRPP